MSEVALLPDNLRQANDWFLDAVYEASGLPFTSFRTCAWLEQEEAKYKQAAYVRAADVLELKRWPSLRARPGEISHRVEAALGKAANLVYRSQPSSNMRAWVGQEGDVRRRVEALTYSLMLKGETLAEIGQHFDALVDYLGEQKLGRKWDLLAFLLFVRDPGRFMPLHSGRFQALADYLGVEVKLSGNIAWEPYEALLQLASDLEEALAGYGPRDLIDVHSWMWVVSGAFKNPPKPRPAHTVTMEEVLERRLNKAIRSARNREVVGALGEWLIMEREQRRLTEAGRSDLAQAIRPVSADPGAPGYDVLSFHPDGRERHIEVKRTERPAGSGDRIHLTENERRAAETDPLWELHRVWLDDGANRVQELGNGVADGTWALEAESWVVSAVED